MPFVKEAFIVPEPTLAFLHIMHTFHLTQGQAQRLIAKGRLLISGKSMFDGGEKISGKIEVVYFKPSSKAQVPLFQTKDFMVFEKASGILVHPNTMSTPYSMLDEVRHHAGDHANAVHRIDMETSGLLLASKHKQAESHLKCGFEAKSITKSYHAWVDGKIDDAFHVDAAIVRNSDHTQTKHKVFIHDDGKPSYTNFEPLIYDKNHDATLLACYPKTGRTHQIRIHLFHVKHPILGDPIYGCSFDAANAYLEGTQTEDERMIESGANRLLLHAHSLRFRYGAEYYIESRMDFTKEKIIRERKQRVLTL